MRKKPKNVSKFKVPQKAVPANLPSAEWLKELQETLKKQSEAAIALIRLTTDAAQRIQQYTARATLAAELFTEEELRTGFVSTRRAVGLITGQTRKDRAEEEFKWLINEIEGEMTERQNDGTWWSFDGIDIQGHERSDEYSDHMTTQRVLQFLDDYARLAKKSLGALDGQNPPKPAKKPGAKRQVPARGRRYKSKSAE